MTKAFVVQQQHIKHEKYKTLHPDEFIINFQPNAESEELLAVQQTT